MLRYVQTDGSTFICHIYDTEPTVWDADTYCLARKLTPEQLEHFGVSKLKLVTPPYFDPLTQRRDEGPAILVDGVWTQNYTVTDLSPEELAEKSNDAGIAIRAKRDAELVASDWTQLPDAPVDRVAWANYRQALRDIPHQTGFPFTVEWPEAPK